MKNILVTGCAGFIGSFVCQRLLEKGNLVIGIDNLNNYYDVDLKKNRLKFLGINFTNSIDYNHENPNFKFIYGSIENESTWDIINNMAINFDFVINLAAQAGVRESLKNPKSYIFSNILGFQNVIMFCVNNNIRLLYASSSSVYGKSNIQPFEENFNCDSPESLYAATKRSNELVAYSYFCTHKLKSIGLRFFTVYGPWGRPDMAPMLFAKSATSNKKIKIYNNGNQMRDFTFISDIVDGIINILDQFDKVCSETMILNIGKGSPVGLMNFISYLEKEFQIEFIKEYLPEQPGDVPLTYASTKLLSRLTQFQPTISLDTGVKLFVEWYKKYHKIK